MIDPSTRIAPTTDHHRRPIEFLHRDRRAHQSARSRSGHRELLHRIARCSASDPDVILVGEMRDSNHSTACLPPKPATLCFPPCTLSTLRKRFSASSLSFRAGAEANPVAIGRHAESRRLAAPGAPPMTRARACRRIMIALANSSRLHHQRRQDAFDS